MKKIDCGNDETTPVQGGTEGRGVARKGNLEGNRMKKVGERECIKKG